MSLIHIAHGPPPLTLGYDHHDVLGRLMGLGIDPQDKKFTVCVSEKCEGGPSQQCVDLILQSDWRWKRHHAAHNRHPETPD